MRAKLLDKGAAVFSELELLEMLLYAGNPRTDTKPLAKDLMTSFGSLSAVLRTPAKVLRDHRGMGDASVTALKIVEATGLHLSHSDIHNRYVLASWSEVVSFKSLGFSSTSTLARHSDHALFRVGHVVDPVARLAGQLTGPPTGLHQIRARLLERLAGRLAGFFLHRRIAGNHQQGIDDKPSDEHYFLVPSGLN